MKIEKFRQDLNKLLKKYNIKTDNLTSISVNFYEKGMIINPVYEVEIK